MKITYIGPFDAVEVDVIGAIVQHGESIDVPDDIAGRAPDPRIAEAMLELRDAVAAIDHLRAQALRDEIIGLDAGVGLLAQTSNWELAAAPRRVSRSTATTVVEPATSEGAAES